MNWTDIGNGLFEVFGGLAIIPSIIKIRKDKQVRGVQWQSIIFFTVWGIWNLIFYPSNGLWLSFLGGISVCSLNLWWVILLIKYRKN